MRMRTRPRAVSPVRFSLFRLPSLRYPPRRKDEARARERAARRRRREDWRLESEEDGISRVRASRLVVRAKQRKRESGKSGERRTRWTRGCRRLHGNEARRECDGNHGSRGFLSRADLSVPLSGLSSSSFSSSGPLPSAHGASKRPTRTPLLSSRSVKERWGGLGLAHCPERKGFTFSSRFHVRFARPHMNPFFRIQKHRVDLDVARK